VNDFTVTFIEGAPPLSHSEILRQQAEAFREILRANRGQWALVPTMADFDAYDVGGYGPDGEFQIAIDNDHNTYMKARFPVLNWRGKTKKWQD